ncbi:MAG: hypothetical protein WB495_10500 [Xanthobacteraceae bacterium]
MTKTFAQKLAQADLATVKALIAEAAELARAAREDDDLRSLRCAVECERRAERLGILAWMIAGCLEWQGRGLAPPAAVTRATAAYLGRSFLNFADVSRDMERLQFTIGATTTQI